MGILFKFSRHIAQAVFQVLAFGIFSADLKVHPQKLFRVGLQGQVITEFLLGIESGIGDDKKIYVPLHEGKSAQILAMTAIGNYILLSITEFLIRLGFYGEWKR